MCKNKCIANEKKCNIYKKKFGSYSLKSRLQFDEYLRFSFFRAIYILARAMVAIKMIAMAMVRMMTFQWDVKPKKARGLFIYVINSCN